MNEPLFWTEQDKITAHQIDRINNLYAWLPAWWTALILLFLTIFKTDILGVIPDLKYDLYTSAGILIAILSRFAVVAYIEYTVLFGNYKKFKSIFEPMTRGSTSNIESRIVIGNPISTGSSFIPYNLIFMILIIFMLIGIFGSQL